MEFRKQEYWSCFFIENYLHLNAGGLTFCCDKMCPGIVVPSKDTEKMVNKFIDMREQVIQANQRTDAPCKGCPRFLLQDWNKCRDSYHISGINWGIQSYCQFSCIYCCLQRDMKESKNHAEPYDALEILNEFNRRGLLSPDLLIEYGSGEIAVHPRREEYLDFIEATGKEIAFATNAGKYDGRVAQLMLKNSSNRIVTSIDCGTPDTFAIIHGVNQFEKVIANLKKYRHYTDQIYLKYICMEENCSIADIEGFIQICTDIQCCQIIISADSAATYNFTQEPLYQPYVVTTAYELVKRAIQRKIPFAIMSYISGENRKALYERISKLPEFKQLQARINGLLESKRIIFYGAGKNCKMILNKWTELRLCSPDLIWDILACDFEDGHMYGLPVCYPQFNALDLESDAIFITIADNSINQMLIKTMGEYGFERFISQEELTFFLDVMSV